MKVYKSYCYYFTSFPINIAKVIPILNDSGFDFFFNFLIPFPKYLNQGNSDPLPNDSGILLTQHVLKQFEQIQVINDFKSCFVYNLPTDISDKEHSRYKKNFTFDFDINELKKEVPMVLILQYEESPWKPILEIDPDYFYLRDEKQILVGSKDFKQVVDWLNKINSDKNLFPDF